MKCSIYIFAAVLLSLFTANTVFAHCDHIDGPVVKDAQIAIEQNDITPVLKWVHKQDEAELKTVFEKTIRVRQAGGETQEIADRLFFETLVRLHRASEGAPYTGLKPAGTPVAGYVTLSDNALERGTPDELIEHLQKAIEHSIVEKFRETYTKKQFVIESPDAGREYVNDYVDFVHYIKYIVDAIKGDGQSHHEH